MGTRATTGRRFVALARGINVGTAKRVSMAQLKAIAESLGFTRIQTVLNSGNVVFTVPGPRRSSPASDLEQAITAVVGFAVPIVALEGAVVDAVVEENPWSGSARDPSRLLIAAFRSGAARARAGALASERWGREQLVCGTHAGYLWCPDGIADSQLVLAMNRVLRDDVTMRNWSTMLRLQAAARAEGK
jgi:uncharacterized protein (DUF1697 family)